MEKIIDLIGSDPLFMIIAAVLGIALIYTAIKKFIKVALLIALAIVIYFGYLAFTGQKIPTSKRELIEHGNEKLEKIRERGIDKDSALKIIKERAMEKAKEETGRRMR